MTAPTLRKRERMVSQKLIETLFGGGSSLSMAAYPLRVVYMKTNRQYGDVPVQLLISVPKKRFKHAVDRNLVKRQVREAFRQHKQVVYDTLPEEEMVLMAFVWLSQEHYSSQEVEKRVVSLLKRMAEKL